jgi:hypothetical protein
MKDILAFGVILLGGIMLDKICHQHEQLRSGDDKQKAVRLPLSDIVFNMNSRAGFFGPFSLN